MSIYLPTGVVAASMLGFVLPPVLYLKAHEVEFRAALASYSSRSRSRSSSRSSSSTGMGSTGVNTGRKSKESVWDGDSMSANDEQEGPSSDASQGHMQGIQISSSYTTNPMTTAYDSPEPRRGSSSGLDELGFEWMSNGKRRIMLEAAAGHVGEDDQIDEERDDGVGAVGSSTTTATGYTNLTTTSHGHNRGGVRWGTIKSLQCSSSSSSSSSPLSSYCIRYSGCCDELLPFIIPIGMILFGVVSLLVGITSVILDNS
jgi:hypothetical protein